MNMMSIEELLKPRYKVIADYPNSRFKIDEILTQWVGNNYSGEDKYYVISNVEKFPHIFKKLEWWEDRKIEDLPEYLKDEFDIVKTKKYYFKNHILRFDYFDEESQTIMFDFIEDYLPATKKEYEDFTKNK